MGERPGELGYDNLDDAGELMTPPNEYLTRGEGVEPAYYGTSATPSATDLTADTTDDQTNQSAAEQDPDQIRHDIERTRQHMSSTVNAIQDKLSPQHLVQEAKAAVHDATIGRAEQVMSDVTDTVENAGNTILDTIRANPIPAVLAAAGLGWLTYKAITNAQANNQYNAQYNYRGYGPGYRPGNGYRASGYTGYDRFGRALPEYQGYDQGYGRTFGGNQNPVGQAASNVSDTVQNAASAAADKVQDVAGTVANTVQDAASSAADTAQQWASQAQDQAQQFGYEAEWQMQRAKNWLERTWETNPLAIGAAALAAGAIIGGLLPETPMEDRLMGDARDNLLQKAEGVAQETVQKAQSAAEQALHQVKQDVVSQQQPGSQAKTQAQSGVSGTSSGATKSAGSSATQSTSPSSASSASSKSASGSTTGNSQTQGSSSSKQTPPPTTGDTSSQTTSSAR